MNYGSQHPIYEKTDAVYNLVDRAIKLSHEKFHAKSIEHVKQISLNNYLNRIVEYIH